MASACVNNGIAMSADTFSSSTTSYGWISPRISFSRDDDTVGKVASAASGDEISVDSAAEFEFRLGDDHGDMLPADKLFSDGKLIPLVATTVAKTAVTKQTVEAGSQKKTVTAEFSISSSDVYLFSPKAPTCTSRWKELLGLRKLHSNSSKLNQSNQNPKSLKNLLHRSSRSNVASSPSASSCPDSPPESSLNLPLLKDSPIPAPDPESITISSSRLSLSSSINHELHEDHPRLSLDSDKSCPGPNPFVRNPNPNPQRIRLVRKSQTVNPGTDDLQGLSSTGSMAVSMDSPRMNSSGKIIFQGLERSSSSPSSFNGGGNRIKYKGMERSYSANVRVTPVLNMPVCSLRGSSKPGSVFGFGPLFSSSPHKKEPLSGSTKNGCTNRSRVDRT